MGVQYLCCMDADKPKIVLCADDDPDDRELLCETATRIDPAVRIVHSENGEQLLIKLRELESIDLYPCLIILDMNMPIMDGRDTLIHIKKNPDWASIPVAIFTTSQREFYKDLEQEYGVNIVTKPAKYSAIIEEVSQLLSHCRAA
jgi:CheY-like chemotaxis protein